MRQGPAQPSRDAIVFSRKPARQAMPSPSSNRHSCLTAPSHRTPYLAFSRDRTKQTGTHLFTGRLPSLDAALKEAEPPISARAHDNAPNARGPVRRRRWAASLRSRTRSRGRSRETSVPDQVRRRLRGSADGVVAAFRIVEADPTGHPIKAPTPRSRCGERR